MGRGSTVLQQPLRFLGVGLAHDDAISSWGRLRESVSPAKRMNFLKKALLSGVRSDKLRAVDGLQGPLVLSGGVSEWLKEHAWKVCIRETVSRVRIPPPPPGQKERKPLMIE